MERGEEEGKENTKDIEEEEEEEGERNSTFCLEFPMIRPSVSIGARGKVLPRDESFT